MGKQIIDFIGELVSISGNSTVDSMIFAVIGAISFLVAFGIVGWIFDATGRYDSDLMSDTHWLVRVLVFAVLTWVGVKIAQAIKWLFSFQWWLYLIAGVVFIGIIILVYYIKHRISKNKAQQVIPVEESNAETTVQTEEKEEPSDYREQILLSSLSFKIGQTARPIRRFLWMQVMRQNRV